MAILLIRHGETGGNAARVVQTPDTPLNDRGIAQAARLAERLGRGFVHILCSDLLRARMTAEPLLTRGGRIPPRSPPPGGGGPDSEVELTPLLQERNFGDWRGTPYSQLPVDIFAPDHVPPGGESVEVFFARVAEAFALIVERRRQLTGNLIVVTHGLVCERIVGYHARVAAMPVRFDNTGVTVIDPEPPFAVQVVNCTEHLAEAARPGGIV
jgi:probable phosphoglycerate mutase